MSKTYNVSGCHCWPRTSSLIWRITEETRKSADTWDGPSTSDESASRGGERNLTEEELRPTLAFYGFFAVFSFSLPSARPRNTSRLQTFPSTSGNRRSSCNYRHRSRSTSSYRSDRSTCEATQSKHQPLPGHFSSLNTSNDFHDREKNQPSLAHNLWNIFLQVRMLPLSSRRRCRSSDIVIVFSRRKEELKTWLDYDWNL